MAALLSMLGVTPAKVLPTLVASDEVYPLHMLDDTKTYRNIVVSWTLRFNDVLDATRLQASLSKLLEIGDWKKLGGRLRLQVNIPVLIEKAANLHYIRRMENSRSMSHVLSLRNVLRCPTATSIWPWTLKTIH